MTVTIDLTTDEQARIEASGINIANLLRGIVASLPATRPAPVPVELPNAKAIAFFQTKMRQPLTDPAEIQEAEAELAAFNSQLNQNRIELGDRPILPE